MFILIEFSQDYLVSSHLLSFLDQILDGKDKLFVYKKKDANHMISIFFYFYNNSFLSSAPDLGERYANGMSRTVIAPFFPSSEYL